MIKYSKHLITILSWFFIVSCNQQENDDQLNKDSFDSLVQFIPENYTFLDTTHGDLNADGKIDLLMILENQDTEAEDNRMLLLLLDQKNNTYKLAKQSLHLIYCKDCGGELGDPYQTVSIPEPGVFTIEHFGGDDVRWARTVSFKYLPAEENWFLTEDALVSSSRETPDDIDVQVLTVKDFGKIKIEDFNIFK